MRKELYFVRHGESEANRLGVLAGHEDLLLTDVGHEQAALCAERLRSVPFAAIYTSDLTRAVQTAAPHEALHGIPAVQTAALREFDAGLWTGRAYAAIATEYPALYPRVWEESFGLLEPPGGEALTAAAERLFAFVSEVSARHAGQALLFVTHAGILRAFWGKLMGIDPSELSRRLPFAANASYSLAVCEDGVLRPLLYGQTADVRGAENA